MYCASKESTCVHVLPILYQIITLLCSNNTSRWQRDMYMCMYMHVHIQPTCACTCMWTGISSHSNDRSLVCGYHLIVSNCKFLPHLELNRFTQWVGELFDLTYTHVPQRACACGLHVHVHFPHVTCMLHTYLQGYLPANIDRREETLQRKRQEYRNFIDQYYHMKSDPLHVDTFRQVRNHMYSTCTCIW